MTWEAGAQAAWVKAANRGELPQYRPSPEPFDAGHLIEKAVARSTGSDRFDGDAFEPLQIFCEALEAEANLTPLGRWATQRYLDRLLDERLLLDQCAAKPAVTDQEIEAPIIVVGPPRSGTTVIHRLLALDPAHRVPEGWEFLFPASTENSASEEAAKTAAAEELGFPQSVAEGLRTIHTYSATMPKECLSAMAFSFRTEEFISRYRVPTYAAWLQDADMAPAYAMHRLVLQTLQSRDRLAGRRWVVKSPVHLQAIPELIATYPDARLVVTHREPADVLASVSSLLANLRSAFADNVDATEIGRYHLRLYANSLSLLADRLDASGLDPARVVHVYHSDIIKNPGSVIRRIYADLGFLPCKEHEVIKREKRDDGLGAHQYTAADFGFVEDELLDEFAAYRERFAVSD